MDIKAILKANGIEGEVVNTIADTIKAEIPKEFVSKTQYSKKVNAIDELNNTIADLEAKVNNPNTDTSKAELETLKAEFETYKTDIETEKANGGKVSLLKKQLKDLNVDEKMIKLLVKEFDLSKIELENDTIKDWETHKELVKDYIPVIETGGVVPNNPPINNPSNPNSNPLADALGKFL